MGADPSSTVSRAGIFMRPRKTDSKSSNCSASSSECRHPTLKHRGNASARWWTCIACGARRPTSRRRKKATTQSSTIAKGKKAKALGFRGSKERTTAGLDKAALMKSKKGKVVSKKQNQHGSGKCRHIPSWTQAGNALTQAAIAARAAADFLLARATTGVVKLEREDAAFFVPGSVDWALEREGDAVGRSGRGFLVVAR